MPPRVEHAAAVRASLRSESPMLRLQRELARALEQHPSRQLAALGQLETALVELRRDV
jgi:hypothetical protein